MTESTQGTDPAAAGNRAEEKKTDAEGDDYTYIDSGIRERHGHVPVWLQLVAYGLLLWGIYYLMRYWNL